MVFDGYVCLFEWVLRFGTLTSRFKDCSNLLTASHIITNLGLTGPAVLGQWMYVAKDFARLMKDEEEVDNEYSYMPYLSDFGISKRSPYSCTVNSECQTWANIVCTLDGSTRSINARMIGETNGNNIMANAILMANAIRSNFAMQVQFYSANTSQVLKARLLATQELIYDDTSEEVKDDEA